ncbi:hypothetical protein ACU4GD_44610 [Cupriavidus basilensis]
MAMYLQESRTSMTWCGPSGEEQAQTRRLTYGDVYHQN